MCDCTFWDERGQRLTRQPVGPLVDTATNTAVMSANRVESGVSAQYAVRSGVQIRAQTLFGYFVPN